MNWQSREDERVARALDGAPPSDGRDAQGLVALADRVRATAGSADLAAEPAFRDALRARLLAEGPALLPRPRRPADPSVAPDAPTPAHRALRTAPGPARHRPPGRAGRRRHRHRAAVAGVLALATLSVSAVAASGTALPGDPLYGLKRRVQGVEVVLARGDVDRGERHLELARIRVRELGTAGRSATAGSLVATLDDMDGETRTGVKMLATVAVRRTDDARLAKLDAWTTEQRKLLSTATPRLPEPARTRAAASAALLADVATRMVSLRTSLRCDCPGAPVDDLGPLPCPGCGRPAPVPPARSGGTDATVPVHVPVPVPATSAPPTVAQEPPRPPRPAPTAQVPGPTPTGAAPTVPPGPTVRPPAASSPPAPRAPEQPVSTPDPTTDPPPVEPGDAVTGIVDGLLGAIGLGG